MSEPRPIWPALVAVALAVSVTFIAVRTWMPPPVRPEALPGESLLREAYAMTREHSVLPLDQERLGEGAVAGLVGAVDPYAEAYGPVEWEIFRQRARGAFTGVGLDLVALGGRTIIASVIPGSPAEEAGIRPGERLLSIDNKPIDDAVDVDILLDGPLGSRVALIVGTLEGADGRGLSVPRRDMDRPTVHATRIDDHTGLLVITEFRPTTPAQFDAAWSKLALMPPQHLIVDVRNNHGGDLDAAAAVADRWIEEGIIYRRVGRTEDSSFGATSGSPLASCRTLLLVNGETASAAEVLAGALSDHGCALMIGERTYGKGAIQEVMAFANSPGGMKITTGVLLTPSGRSLESHLPSVVRGVGGGGLIPDVVIKVPAGNRAALERARHRERWPLHVRELVERHDGANVADEARDIAMKLLR